MRPVADKSSISFKATVNTAMDPAGPASAGQPASTRRLMGPPNRRTHARPTSSAPATLRKHVLAAVTGLIVIGLFIAGTAGAMAWFIAYDEMSRHFPSRAEARRHALGSAFAAFAFFVVLIAVLAVLIPRMLGS
jgi:hypothetical protein